MICHCGAKMKCVDSRPRGRGIHRKRVCPKCGEVRRTLERPVDEWDSSTPKQLDQLALRLVAISTLTKEASEIIYEHLKGDKR